MRTMSTREPARPVPPREPLPPAPGSAAERVAELRASLEAVAGELAALADQDPAGVYQAAMQLRDLATATGAAAIYAAYAANGYSDADTSRAMGGVPRSTLWAAVARRPEGKAIRAGKARAGLRAGRRPASHASPHSSGPSPATSL